MAALRIPRIVVYILTNWMAIVAGAAALNALVKARHDRDNKAREAAELASRLYPGLTVEININDILTSGGFLAAGEILLSLIAFFSAICLIFPALTHRTDKKSVQGFAVGCWVFALLWTFGTAVATTDYAVNRDAKVTAYVNGVKLDPQIVSALQKSTGLSPEYWIHGYTKFVAITPWILIPLAIISLAFTVVAWRNLSSSTPETVYTGSRDARVITGSAEEVKEKDVVKEGV